MKVSISFLALSLLFGSGILAQPRRHDNALELRDQGSTTPHTHHHHRTSKRPKKLSKKEECSSEKTTASATSLGDYSSGEKGNSGHGHGGDSGVGRGGGSGGLDTQSGDRGHKSRVPPNAYVPTNPPGGGGNSKEYITVRGIKGSKGTLPSEYDFSQFSLNVVHKGKGTQFGDNTYDNTKPWQGGACMYDNLPHKDLPSVAMNQLNWLDGLACGSCVEIWNTPPNAFKPGVHWQLEKAEEVSNKPPGNTTLAFVSDLCPGLDQCYTGLDAHYDTWNSYTGLTSGTELQMQWRFVDCQKLFERTGAGGDSLEVHWRDGSSQGYCNVQIRGSYKAVVNVEAQKDSGGEWLPTTHRDNSFFAIEDCGPDAKFRFRLTDWEGKTIETEAGTFAPINTHVRITGVNFD